MLWGGREEPSKMLETENRNLRAAPGVQDIPTQVASGCHITKILLLDRQYVLLEKTQVFHNKSQLPQTTAGPQEGIQGLMWEMQERRVCDCEEAVSETTPEGSRLIPSLPLADPPSILLDH